MLDWQGPTGLSTYISTNVYKYVPSSGRPDARTSGRPDVGTSRRTSGRPDVRTSRRPDVTRLRVRCKQFRIQFADSRKGPCYVGDALRFEIPHAPLGCPRQEIKQHTQALPAATTTPDKINFKSFVDVRGRTSTYVHVRRRTSTYVDIRPRTSTYVDVRPRTWTYVEWEQQTSRTCHWRAALNVKERCHKVN